MDQGWPWGIRDLEDKRWATKAQSWAQKSQSGATRLRMGPGGSEWGPNVLVIWLVNKERLRSGGKDDGWKRRDKGRGGEKKR